MTSADEIEVNVRQIEEPAATTGPTVQVFEVLRKLMLAGFGAFALTREEAEALLNRLVERGELAQKDAQRIMDETMSRFRTTAQAPATQVEGTVNNLTSNVSSQVSGLTHQMESNLEQFLNRLNIPSKRDIDELSAKIAQLAARVEELRRSQETATPKARVGKLEGKPADESAS
jgi:poly(hydroxyalkanoate) granule-associated protein